MIRNANFNDLKEICLLLESFCDQANLPYENSSMINFVESATTGWNYLVLVSSPSSSNGPLNGLLVASVQPWLADVSHLVTQELIRWAKDPDLEKRLSRRYARWAKDAGASKIGAISYNDPPR